MDALPIFNRRSLAFIKRASGASGKRPEAAGNAAQRRRAARSAARTAQCQRIKLILQNINRGSTRNMIEADTTNTNEANPTKYQ